MWVTWGLGFGSESADVLQEESKGSTLVAGIKAKG
jgi:hypothetical protein